MAARLALIGVDLDRDVLANFETGRRATITVEEWLALAYVLDVSPLDILVPTDGAALRLGDVDVNPDRLLDWFRAEPLPGQDEQRFRAQPRRPSWWQGLELVRQIHAKETTFTVTFDENGGVTVLGSLGGSFEMTDEWAAMLREERPAWLQ